MSEPWEELKDAVLGAVRDSLRDFMDDEAVAEFAKKKALEMAKQKWLAATAKEEPKRREHEDNLRHLAAQVKGEAARLLVAAGGNVGEWIGRILSTAASVLLKIGPKMIGGL